MCVAQRATPYGRDGGQHQHAQQIKAGSHRRQCTAGGEHRYAEQIEKVEQSVSGHGLASVPDAIAYGAMCVVNMPRGMMGCSEYSQYRAKG